MINGNKTNQMKELNKAKPIFDTNTNNFANMPFLYKNGIVPNLLVKSGQIEGVRSLWAHTILEDLTNMAELGYILPNILGQNLKNTVWAPISYFLAFFNRPKKFGLFYHPNTKQQ